MDSSVTEIILSCIYSLYTKSLNLVECHFERIVQTKVHSRCIVKKTAA